MSGYEDFYLSVKIVRHDNVFDVEVLFYFTFYFFIMCFRAHVLMLFVLSMCNH